MSLSLPELYTQANVTIRDYLPETGDQTRIRQILAGLCVKRKFISSMYFYDAAGSKLFETITSLPEYYLTRTETALIKSAAETMADQLDDLDIVEIGSGDCSKISLLFEAADGAARSRLRYIPLDVSRSAIDESARRLSALFPEITIQSLVADFLSQLHRIPTGRRKLVCFFGSTIGNLFRSQADRFVCDISRIMNPGDQLLMGLDRVKEVTVLEAAYNDARQVTAAFNRNILNVVNRLAGTDFDPDVFDHVAFYNPERARIEMHLKAVRPMMVTCPHLRDPLRLGEGEMIHTENSHKFTQADITALSRRADLNIQNQWTDPNEWFTLVQFEKG